MIWSVFYKLPDDVFGIKLGSLVGVALGPVGVSVGDWDGS